MSNRTILSVTAAAAAFVGISACTTLPVTTDYNPTVGIGVCRTYAFATEHYRSAGDPAAYAQYRACLNDTFGPEYVEHLERWLEADGVTVIVPA